jgi:peptide/nickel transport system substrate-binding protein
MAYAHVPGAGGLVLVPDLAAESPAVDGRDYLFRLRSGIRYSNGAPLRASDVRSTFERQIRLQGAMSDFATRIDGAQDCSRQHCDLSASIRTDDTAGTVRIRLRRPDPIFTSLLAFPEATIVPSSTPARLADPGAIPGTGPYRVAAFTPLRRVELVRNTYFHEWSRIAQPDGYPDSIAVNVVSPKEFRVPDADTTRITNALENGSMDVYPDLYTYRLPPQFMRERALAGRFRVTEAPGLGVADIMLNTHLPPFNNPKARQAVSYAVDRAELIRRQNRRAYADFTPTCQLIPPGTSGYQPYCPTTANPGTTQRWTGPDLARGQQLVRESGTQGQPVTVWEPSTPFDPDGSYLVDLLNQLGYRARLHTPRPDFDPYIKHVATGTVQASVIHWGNLPRAVDALSYFSCDGFDARRHDYENNLTGFCDHSIDAEYTRAVELSTGERPSDANPLWIDLDRRLTDAAAFVPIWNENFYVLTGRRVGNVISTSFYGVLLDQLWVQ